MDIGSSGSGIFIMRNYGHSSERYSLNGELRYYDIKGDDETIVVDYKGQYKTLGGKSLFMLPAFIGANYYPFVGKIENNFSPFITVKGGMLTTVNGREFGSFIERWKNSMKSLGRGGRVVTCGSTTGFKAEINLTHLFFKQQSILGSTMGSKSAFNEALSLLNDGKIKPVVDRIFPISKIPNAHKYLESGKQFGKVVLSYE